MNNFSFTKISQSIKAIICTMGLLVSNDMSATENPSVEKAEIVMPTAVNNKMLEMFSQMVGNMSAILRDLQKTDIVFWASQSITSQDIEEFYQSLSQLHEILVTLESHNEAHYREAFKKLRKFNIELQGFYEQIATYVYKQEADATILSRTNSSVALSFTEANSRDEIYKALLG